MNKETTKAEQNKLIAIFMGASLSTQFTDMETYTYDVSPTDHSSYSWTQEAMEYHSRWDWLMPVVEKIETTNQLFIDGNACKIWTGDLEKDYIFSEENSKIEAVYQAVLQFIEYYNKLKEPKV